MFFKIGLALLFFLPIIESIDRTIALCFLLFGSLFMGIPFILRKKISLDYLDILFLMILVIFTVSTIFSWSVTRSFTELLRYVAYFLVFVGLRNYCESVGKLSFRALRLRSGQTPSRNPCLPACADRRRQVPTFGMWKIPPLPFDKLRIGRDDERTFQTDSKRGFIEKFYFSMVLVNTFILSILSLLYLIPWFKLPIPSSGMNLFYPVYRHNRIVDILIFAIPLALFVKVPPSHRLHLNVLNVDSVLAGFFIIAFIFSMGRAALLSLTFSFFLYFFLQKDKFHKALTPWVTLLGVITIFILSSIFIYSNFVIKEEEKVWQPLRRLYRPIESDFRIDYAVQALKGFSLSPIFGTGLDTFRLISEKYQGKETFSYSWYTHNHYLQMFTETGVFGGLLFMVFILILLNTAYKNIRHHPERSPSCEVTRNNKVSSEVGRSQIPFGTWRSEAIFISLLASSIQSLLDFNWQFISIFLLFWIGVGLLLSK